MDTMKLQIHYTTQVKAALGIDHEEIELPDGARLNDIISILTEKYPEPFGRFVVDPMGKLLPSILPCVDDAQVLPSDNPQLTDGASVTFLSAISGG